MSNKKELIGEEGEILVFNRRSARDLAFKYIFQYIDREDDIFKDIAELSNSSFGKEDLEYINRVVKGTTEKLDELDGYIIKYAKGWKKERISKVCLSIMRMAIYEIIYMEDIPVGVSINEAIDIVKKYDDPKTAAFTNGILGNVQKEMEKDQEELHHE